MIIIIIIIIDGVNTVDQKINLQKTEKKDKYLDLAREFKKNCGI